MYVPAWAHDKTMHVSEDQIELNTLHVD
jgi:hypothetical protein